MSYVAGTSAVTHCDGRALSMPDKSTVLVHEIKARGKESHDGKHFADLLTSDDALLRSKVARPVAQAFGYAVSAMTAEMYLHRLVDIDICPCFLHIEHMKYSYRLLCHLLQMSSTTGGGWCTIWYHQFQEVPCLLQKRPACGRQNCVLQ